MFGPFSYFFVHLTKVGEGRNNEQSPVTIFIHFNSTVVHLFVCFPVVLVKFYM